MVNVVKLPQHFFLVRITLTLQVFKRTFLPLNLDCFFINLRVLIETYFIEEQRTTYMLTVMCSQANRRTMYRHFSHREKDFYFSSLSEPIFKQNSFQILLRVKNLNKTNH